jgi:hypothetical protein
MSKFFKSDWFKCVAVLLIIAVVLSGTLALLNDVLYVSPEERTGRAIKKIYDGVEKEFTVELDIDANDNAIVYENVGSINKIYRVENDFLFQVTGYNGYKNGTVTLWVKVIKTQEGKSKIDKVILENYDKQTLMSKFDDNYYKLFYVDVTDNYQTLFAPKGSSTDKLAPNTGATKSANAACNAVNCVLIYMGEQQ